MSKRLYLTSTEVAKLCDCDLRTVYNWSEGRGVTPPDDPFPVESLFFTPGRHRRFHPSPVITWARRRGCEISDEMKERLAESHVITLIGHPRRVEGSSALLFHQHMSWVAVCITHDIRAYGKTPETVIARLPQIIAAECAFSTTNTIPLPDPPPQRVINVWKNLEPKS